MATKEITMDTDWGARGAQLNGQQVQDFIKGQFKGLINKTEDLQGQVTNNRLEAITDEEIEQICK